MVVLVVRFKSRMSEEQLLDKSRDRAPQYRALKGLKQKYYLRYPESGEYGAVYLWETEAALEEFRESDLARTIPTAYEIDGVPSFQLGEVFLTLRS